MEQAGFARSNVAGEYYPLVAWAFPTATISTTATTASFAEACSVYIVTESQNEQLSVQVSGVCASSFGGGSTPRFSIRVDGVEKGQVWQTYPSTGGSAHLQRTTTITGLSPGVHKVSLFWANSSAGTLKCDVTLNPQVYYMSLIAWRTQRPSDKESAGFVFPNWPVERTTGVTFAHLTSSVTNTTTSPATSLLLQNVQSFHPTSALLIRFGVAGTNNSNVIAKFRILVDGVVQGGTSQTSGGAGFRFNTSMITVVAVNAGWHTVEVQWCGGGTSGSTINPVSNLTDFAELLVEEVMCADVGNPVQDTGGFPVTYYSARNLPQVRFAKLTSDLTGTGAGPPNQVVGQIDIYVTGDNSSVQIEATFGGDNEASGDTPNFRLWIDTYTGVIGNNTTNNIVCGQGVVVPGTGGMSGSISRVVQLPQGWHRILVCWASLSASSSLKAASSPDTSHGSVVVREINAIPLANVGNFAIGTQL